MGSIIFPDKRFFTEILFKYRLHLCKVFILKVRSILFGIFCGLDGVKHGNFANFQTACFIIIDGNFKENLMVSQSRICIDKNY